MHRRRTVTTLAAVLVATAALGLALGWREGRRLARSDAPRGLALAAAPVDDARAVAEDAIRFYAAGQFPRACERLEGAAAANPSSDVLRSDTGRCFERWGWQALRDGRPVEAAELFRQALRANPEAPALLKALGLAEVHAGRPERAVGPLERAVRGEPDREARLLLAHLYDRRDEPSRAIAHLRILLEHDPHDVRAQRLLDKVERERLAEAGFARDVAGRFVLRHQGVDAETRRAVVAALDQAADRVGQALGWQPPGPLTVVLYTSAQFRSVARVHSWAGGLFDGRIRLVLGEVPPGTPPFQRLAVHELTHAAVHELTRGRAPRWLHEGLAQLLEGTTVDPMLRVPGRVTLAGIETLLTSPDALHARTGYDLALWVVQDLADRGGLPALQDLLGRLGAGEPLAAAVPRVYGLRLAEIESHWRRLLGG